MANLIFWVFILLFNFPSFTKVAAIAIDDSFLYCLENNTNPQDHISNLVYYQTNASYTPILRDYMRNARFNTSTTPKPHIIITPKQITHVQATVLCTKKLGYQLKIRSGGHDFEGISYISDIPFFLLDMFNLRSIQVEINNESQSAWVQAGATLGELYYAISLKSKLHGFPAGVGGHISGGGYGNMLRKYGLSVDNVVDAQIVDVNGKLMNREQMGNEFPQLGLKMENCIQLSWIQSGLWWASLDTNDISAMLDRKLDTSAKMGKRKSDYVQTPIPKKGLKLIWKKMIELGKTELVFNPYGGRMSEIGETDAPFPHRAGNLFKIQYSVNWKEEGKEAENNYLSQIRKLHSFMSPYVSNNPRSAYLSYRDLDIGVMSMSGGKHSYEEATVYGIKYFKANFDRLVKVKTQVDPNNFFKNEQSIPTYTSADAAAYPRCFSLLLQLVAAVGALAA
ncbi:berberine bridge enzyme-like 21 isoform X2 [Euphorbia lathyris]|uniref:berberine bridge enzyme-like 21 isoform X2 n=1 Tax=Euphorbia lathyris TaxID=212925 RepID=UPI0033137F46